VQQQELEHFPMIRELLTLREIARRLDVPPSSIAYYKDRFARFLPAGEGRGRRLRYPVHVLDIFREIRSMYTRNVAAEQIEKRLEELTAMLSAQGGPGAQGGQPGDPHRLARTGGVDGGGARASGAGAEPYRRERLQDFDGTADGGTRGFPHGMAQGADGDPAVEGLPGMLDRMATLLQVQGHMLAELSSLRRQVEELRADRDALLAAFDERAARLDGALELLRRERAEAVTRLVDDYYTAASGVAGADSRVDSGGGTGANPHAQASSAGSTADGDFSSAQFEAAAADAGPSSTEAGRPTRHPAARALPPCRLPPCSSGRWSSAATASSLACPAGTRRSPCASCWPWWNATPPGGTACPWGGGAPAPPGCCA